MTISTSASKVTWQGNGAASTFTYSFPITNISEVVLTYTDANGNQTVLQGSQYTITGINSDTTGNAPYGGTVTYPISGPAISAGTSLTLERIMPYTQPTSLTNQGGLWPTVVESADDVLELQIQQIADATNRAVTANVADSPSLNMELPPAAQRADQFLGFDSSGNVLVSQPSGAPISAVMQPVVGAATLSAAMADLGITVAMQEIVAAATVQDALNDLVANIITNEPNVSFAPTGNTPTTYGTLVVQGNSANIGQRQFLGSFNFYSNTDHGVSGADHVALYTGIVADAGSSNVWSINPLIELAAGAPTDIDAQGLEVDCNNNNANRGSAAGSGGITPPVFYGVSISGASSHSSTAGLCVAGVTNNQWYRGVMVTGSSVYSAFSDYSGATTGMEIFGSHSIGIDMNGSVQLTAIRTGNNQAISSRNGANSAEIQIALVNSANNLLVGTGAGAIYSGSHLMPADDNTYTLGISTNRWTAVWAVNGTIQTSDPSLKTAIAPLPDALPLINAIHPVTYKWKVGGVEKTETKEIQIVQDTETVEYEVDHVEMKDGVPVLGKRTVKTDRPAFDEVQVRDADGNLVFYDVPAKPALYSKKGELVRPAQPARRLPRMHRAPRMVQKEVVVTKDVERPGNRTHWGFLAPDVKAAFDAAGLDFGGYVKAEDGTQHLRPTQLIPVLWKAVQELAAEVEELKRRDAGEPVVK